MDASGDITDFGARVFDADFPMFLSRDRFESHFPTYTPYNYAVGSPNVVKDNDGNVWELYVHGGPDVSMTAYAINTIQLMFDNKVHVEISNDIVCLEFVSGESEASLDLNQRLLYKNLMKVITDDETIYQEIVIHNKTVNIGAYRADGDDWSSTGVIDFGDLNQYATNPKTKFYALSSLAHEVFEQFVRMTKFENKPVIGFDKDGNRTLIDSYSSAHGLASAIEELVGNYKMVNKGLGGDGYSWEARFRGTPMKGIFKVAINIGGYDGVGSTVTRFLGLTEEPVYRTIEATYQNGTIVDTDVKEGNTLEDEGNDTVE